MADELISRQAAIEILQKSHKAHAQNCREEVLLDRDIRLLKEIPAVDAMVLPCKVGDTVYVLGESVVSEIPVLQIIIDEDECFVCAIGDFRGGCYPFSAFGKTVFLTRELAEEALNGKKEL